MGKKSLRELEENAMLSGYNYMKLKYIICPKLSKTEKYKLGKASCSICERVSDMLKKYGSTICYEVNI